MRYASTKQEQDVKLPSDLSNKRNVAVPRSTSAKSRPPIVLVLILPVLP